MEFLGQHAKSIQKCLADLGRPDIRVKHMDKGALYDDNVKKAIEELKEGEILLLKNVRPEEEDQSKITALEKLFDLFAIDGFSVAHRGKDKGQFSIEGFSNIPNVAGRLMEREIEGLSNAVKPEKIKSPYVMSLGGLKLPEVMPLLAKALDEKRVEKVITGGA